jgi:predicted transcriptional regulator
MALEGSLRDFGFADILQLIFFQRKTGVLTIEGRLDKVRLLFIEGNITGAESKRRIEANRLGKVLVKKGLLSEDDLQEILREQKSTNAKLGNILIRKGFVQKEQVEEILVGQIKETIVQIFNWKEGTYDFTPQAVPADKDIPVAIDTQHLLMEGLRIVDEWTLIEGKITLDAVFTKKAGVVSELTEEEKDMLQLVDGENDVSTIIDISGKDDYIVSKTLVSLIEKGFVETKEIMPVIAEVRGTEIEKPMASYNILPLLVISLAFLISLLSVFLDTGSIYRKFTASSAIDDIRFKIEVYRTEHGAYPASLDMVSKRSDPWGNAYIYKQEDGSFILRSTGPDGRKGTPDDIY